MSYNSFKDRYLSCEDDEFVLKVDKDIRDYLQNFAKNRYEKLKVKNPFVHPCTHSFVGSEK